MARLEDLVRRSPGNVPFLVRLAVAQSAAGRKEAGVATLKHAVGLNPRLEFLHAHLAGAYLELGRLPEARAEYELAVELNPRYARAWLGLGEIARALRPAGRRARGDAPGRGRRDRQRAHLEPAGRGGAGRGQRRGRARAAEEATRLVPELAEAWLVRGKVAEKGGRLAEAVAHYEKAVALGLADPRLGAHLQRLRSRPGPRP